MLFEGCKVRGWSRVAGELSKALKNSEMKVGPGVDMGVPSYAAMLRRQRPDFQQRRRLWQCFLANCWVQTSL
jgi:hypothetical protein